jgi:hypothetical protein
MKCSMEKSLLGALSPASNCGVLSKAGLGLLAGALLACVATAEADPAPPLLTITFDNPDVTVRADGSTSNELAFTVVNTGMPSAVVLSTSASFTSGNDSLVVSSPVVYVTGDETVTALGPYSGGGTTYSLGSGTLFGHIVYTVPAADSGDDGVNTIILTVFGSSDYSLQDGSYVLNSSLSYSQTVSQNASVTLTTVPEPGSLALAGLGALALLWRRKA